jgi:hypothetical protein
MSHKQADPYWAVQGVSRGQDVCLVIEAASETAAECFATKRGVEVVLVTEARRSDVTAARLAGRLWRYTPEPRLKVLGRPVGRMQAACFVLCGLATVLLDLRAHRVPMRLSIPKTAFNITISGPSRAATINHAVPPAPVAPRLA